MRQQLYAMNALRIVITVPKNPTMAMIRQVNLASNGGADRRAEVSLKILFLARRFQRGSFVDTLGGPRTGNSSAADAWAWLAAGGVA